MFGQGFVCAHSLPVWKVHEQTWLTRGTEMSGPCGMLPNYDLQSEMTLTITKSAHHHRTSAITVIIIDVIHLGVETREFSSCGGFENFGGKDKTTMW